MTKYRIPGATVFMTHPSALIFNLHRDGILQQHKPDIRASSWRSILELEDTLWITLVLLNQLEACDE